MKNSVENTCRRFSKELNEHSASILKELGFSYPEMLLKSFDPYSWGSLSGKDSRFDKWYSSSFYSESDKFWDKLSGYEFEGIHCATDMIHDMQSCEEISDVVNAEFKLLFSIAIKKAKQQGKSMYDFLRPFTKLDKISQLDEPLNDPHFVRTKVNGITFRDIIKKAYSTAFIVPANPECMRIGRINESKKPRYFFSAHVSSLDDNNSAKLEDTYGYLDLWFYWPNSFYDKNKYAAAISDFSKAMTSISFGQKVTRSIRDDYFYMYFREKKGITVPSAHIVLAGTHERGGRYGILAEDDNVKTLQLLWQNVINVLDDFSSKYPSNADEAKQTVLWLELPKETESEFIGLLESCRHELAGYRKLITGVDRESDGKRYSKHEKKHTKPKPSKPK